MTGHGFHYGPCRSGRGGVAGVIIVLVVAGLVARAAVHAVAEALPYILGAVAVTGVLGGVAAAALVSATRDRRGAYTAVADCDNDSDTQGVTYQRYEPVAAPPRRAELPPVEQHVHIHVGSAAEAAKILAVVRKETQP